MWYCTSLELLRKILKIDEMKYIIKKLDISLGMRTIMLLLYL